MTKAQHLKNLKVPIGKVDIVLDTDAFNEVDDQFAICYALKSKDKFNIKGICAAPFFNDNSSSAGDGMEKSYNEIIKLLTVAKCQNLINQVYRGSETYLKDEVTPVESLAADFIANLANNYSPEKPLYIIAIGAITNVASAILKNPNIKENCVIVWLGGHALHIDNPVYEFNMRQDIAAARVVLASGVPLVHLPCGGVVDHMSTSRYELEHWLKGKNELADYLLDYTVKESERIIPFKAWTKIIWDITAIAWFFNEDGRFMRSKEISAFMPEYDGSYSYNDGRHLISYVQWVSRDAIFEDLFLKLVDNNS